MEERSLPLLGNEVINKLNNSHIAIFGIGGVGGFVCEALARQGVGEFSIFDFDIVSKSNINRQIIALSSTIGKKKVDIMKERILDINPKAKVNTYDWRIAEENIELIDFSKFDYVADCIDDVKGKIMIISQSKKENIKIISSMGTGNKLDPMKFLIKDISKTTVCPLAKTVRLQLRKLGITDVKVLYSLEEPIKNADFISSVSFVPSVAGLLIAREIILDIKRSIGE